MTQNLLRSAALFSVLSCVVAVQAQSVRESDPVFTDKDILNVSLSAPLETIMDERSVTDEIPGKFSFTNAEGDTVEFDVAVRSRGIFRRRADVCEFAPIRLNFKKSQTKDTLFHKQDKVKIVTHCKNDSDRYQQTVITEFIAYEILNLFTPLSYEVRLLQVDYKDTEMCNIMVL